MWEEFSWILQGYGADIGGGKHGQYFANARPLYLRKIIVCVLITLQGIRFNEILSNWSSMARTGLKPDAVVFLTSLYTSTEKTKMWFCHPDPEKPALSAKNAYVSNLLFFKSNNILLYYIAVFGNGPDIYRYSLLIH